MTPLAKAHKKKTWQSGHVRGCGPKPLIRHAKKCEQKGHVRQVGSVLPPLIKMLQKLLWTEKFFLSEKYANSIMYCLITFSMPIVPPPNIVFDTERYEAYSMYKNVETFPLDHEKLKYCWIKCHAVYHDMKFK